MNIRAAGKVRAAIPECLRHWDKRIGFGNRLEIQLTALGRTAMLAANSTAAMLTGTTSPGLERLVHKAAAHINYLQADQLELHRNSELVSQYHKWFLQAPLGFHILDSDGVIQDVNSKWLEMLGYQRAQVIGQPIFNFIIPCDRELIKSFFGNIFSYITFSDIETYNF